MIMASDIFEGKIREHSRNFRCRVKANDEYLDVSIKSAKVVKGMMGHQVCFGTVFIPSLEMDLMELDGSLLGKDISIEAGLMVAVNEDGSKDYEYVKMGTFHVTEESFAEGVTRVLGVGMLASKMEGLYVSELSYPATVGEVAFEITEATGIMVAFGDEIDSNALFEEKPEGLKYREVLGYIGGLVGANVTEDANSNVMIKRMGTGEEFAFSGDRCIESPVFSNQYRLLGIRVIAQHEQEAEEGNVIPETSFEHGNIVKMEYVNPYMTQANFDLFKEDVVGLEYSPAEISLALGDPRIEPWDVILFNDRNGDVHRVPCLGIVHVFDGGFSSTITAAGAEEVEKTKTTTGPITEMIERTHIKMQSVENLLAGKVSASQLEVVDAKVEELQATSANLEKLKTEVAQMDEAYIDRLGAMDADIENLQISKLEADIGKIEKAWAKELLVHGDIFTEDINAASGSFSHYLTGVNILGDNITAGTISAKRLIIASEDGEEGLLFALNEHTNSLEETPLDRNEIERLTLDGRIITADSINADKINVRDLFAQDITSTGDFNIGGQGALFYNSKDKTLSIDAKAISIEGKNVVTEENLEECKTLIAQTKDKISLEAEKNASNAESVKKLRAKMGILADSIDLAVKTAEDVNATFNFTAEGLEIGRSDSAIKSIQDNESYKFKDNADNVLLNVDTSGIDASSMSVQKQVSYYGKWATRKGLAVEGVGHNLNDVWIGG